MHGGLCVLLAAVVVLCAVHRVGQERQQRQERFEEPRIPKQIWTYWAGGDVPDVVRRCVQTWAAHNPDYRITVLGDANLRRHVGEDLSTAAYARFRDSPQRFADLVRLHVMAEHGGFWLDASVVCNRSLEWMRQLQVAGGHELVGYYIDGATEARFCAKAKVIENWIFACVPGSRFMRDWRDEFTRIRDFESVDAYLEDVKAGGVSLQRIGSPNYLAMHVAAQRLLQRPGADYRLHLSKAEDTAFKYLFDAGWDSERAVDALLTRRYDDQPLIKLRGSERGVLSGRDYAAFFDAPGSSTSS